MKRMKKFVSVMLALVMLCAMNAAAFADGTGYTITVNNAADGHTYQAYQIFKGDLADSGVLSNIQWGDGVDGAGLLDDLMKISAFSGCKSAADVVEVLDNKSHDSDIAKQFAQIVGKHLSTEFVSSTRNTEVKNYTITGLKAGYYLVKDKDKSEFSHDSYTRFILQVVKDVSVTPKSGVPKVDKKIVDGEERVDANEVSIGDIVTYEITGTLPSNIADYNTYYYVFNDTLSKGLTFNLGSVKVTVNGVDVTKYFYIADEPQADGTTKLTVGIQDLLALKNAKDITVGAITAQTEIVVTYTAELNKDAQIDTTGNDNVVDLVFSNDPNHSGAGATGEPSDNPGKPTPDENQPTGKTPESKVTTYTTEIIIEKVDGNDKPLTGAAFEITGDGVNIVVTTGEVYVKSEEGTYYKLNDGTYTETEPTEDTVNQYVDAETTYKKETTVTLETKGDNAVKAEAFVGVDGKLKFTGLGAGTYTIKETVTPPGYNTAADTEVTIAWTKDNGWTYEWKQNNTNIDNITNTIKIVNQAGATLPTTGGMGTTLFYVVGGVLMLGAIVVLIARKRVNAER